ATVEGDIAEVVNGAGSLLRVIGEKYRATALTAECEDVVEQARRCYLSDWVRLKPLSAFGNIVWITRQSWSSTVELLIGKWTDIEGSDLRAKRLIGRQDQDAIVELEISLETPAIMHTHVFRSDLHPANE